MKQSFLFLTTALMFVMSPSVFAATHTDGEYMDWSYARDINAEQFKKAAPATEKENNQIYVTEGLVPVPKMPDSSFAGASNTGYEPVNNYNETALNGYMSASSLSANQQTALRPVATTQSGTVKFQYPVQVKYPVQIKYPVQVQPQITVQRPIMVTQPIEVQRPVVMTQPVTVQQPTSYYTNQPITMQQQPIYMTNQPMVVQQQNAQPLPVQQQLVSQQLMLPQQPMPSISPALIQSLAQPMAQPVAQPVFQSLTQPQPIMPSVAPAQPAPMAQPSVQPFPASQQIDAQMIQPLVPPMVQPIQSMGQQPVVAQPMMMY